ncbi:hypothetical protein [Sphingopyxis sp. FD7]|uniref:hypothetical protein n=1 Tax=Sphingopyxis sp. FD7 TaxID=1914525 RepID=UPI0011BAAEF3|nr:hypothetical protein [Sphingopyxis sp. FD7]
MKSPSKPAQKGQSVRTNGHPVGIMPHRGQSSRQNHGCCGCPGVTAPARTWLGSLYGDNIVQFDLIAHQAMAQKFLRDAHSARLKIAEAVVIDTDPVEH